MAPPLLDQRAVRASWQSHFAGLLKAEVTSFSALQAQQEAKRLIKFNMVRGADAVEILELIPLRAEVASIFRKQRGGKGFGEDSLPSECYSSAHVQMAEAFLPSCAITALTGCHPLMWKGGYISELYKGKGDPSRHASFRDITLEDLSSKAFCKVMR